MEQQHRSTPASAPAEPVAYLRPHPVREFDPVDIETRLHWAKDLAYLMAMAPRAPAFDFPETLQTAANLIDYLLDGVRDRLGAGQEGHHD